LIVTLLFAILLASMENVFLQTSEQAVVSAMMVGLKIP